MSFVCPISDEAFAEAVGRLGVVRVGGRADGFSGKSRGEIVEGEDGGRYWFELVGWVAGDDQRLPDGEIETGSTGAARRQGMTSRASSVFRAQSRGYGEASGDV